jgi:hypothetical protein
MLLTSSEEDGGVGMGTGHSDVTARRRDRSTLLRVSPGIAAPTRGIMVGPLRQAPGWPEETYVRLEEE